MKIQQRGAVRIAVDYVLNLLAAMFATAIVESEFYGYLRGPGSVHTKLMRELLLSVVVAAALGCVAGWFRQSTARWVWVPPLLFSLVVFASGMGMNQRCGVLTSGGLLTYMDCNPVRFFLLTVPTVRGLMYAAAAAAILHLRKPASGTPEDAAASALG